MSLKERFPTRNQITLVYASIVFPLYSWTTYSVLDYLPSWLKSMRVWEIFSVNAYAYAWTLIESLILLLFISAMAIIVPVKWLKEHFASKGSVFVWTIYIFSFVIQINGYAIGSKLGTGLMLLASIIISFFLISRFRRINDIVVFIADRLIVFLYVYIPISLISIMVVIYNNLRTTP